MNDPREIQRPAPARTAARCRHSLFLVLAAAYFAIGPAHAAMAPARPAELDLLSQDFQTKFKRLELGTRHIAYKEAMFLAQVYLRADEHAYPGIRQFGRKLAEVLKRTGVDGVLYFKQVVSRNPEFWRAERELTVIDPSLPYLVAMLAVLSDDHITASRMLALAQATLPLTPVIRRVYAKPEGLLRYQDKVLLYGVTPAVRFSTTEAAESASLVVRQRMSAWPKRMELLVGLIDLRARRQQLAMASPSELEGTLAELVQPTEDARKFVREHDPIMAATLSDSTKDWLGKTTLLQQWMRWMDESDPAEPADIERSVAVYEAAGRADLAWLTWRHSLVAKGVVSEKEQRRWQAWSEQLLGTEAADRLVKETAANPRAGTASIPVPFERDNEVWSGDQGMHPLLAIKLERELAGVDAQLAFFKEGARFTAMLHLKRAQCLLQIGSLDGAKKEYAQAEKVLGSQVMEPMLAFMLSEERRYDEAEQVYLRILKNPTKKQVRRSYADALYKAGRYEAARVQYRESAQEFPNDEYRVIMADLAARRGGRNEAELLRTIREKLLPGSWTDAGISYLQGEISAEELMVRARQGTPYAVIQHECEGSFWIAQVALAEGRTGEGVQWLRRCLATGFTTYVEYLVARAELERLKPEEQKKDKESTPRDSRWSIPA